MNTKHGPYVTKLIIQFMAREAVPPGGGLPDVVEFIRNEKRRKKVLEEAERKALESIQLVKNAPDNPFGDDDEMIAGMLLEKIEQAKSDLLKKGLR